MRVTNSMLVNNFMRNLNNNLTKMDKLQSQIASGRKYAHISDDPIALIYGQAARNKLARLSHYQRTVDTAQNWLRQAESALMDLQERAADVYHQVVGAATDVNNPYDKHNISMLVREMRDHYLDTLNASFGDKFIFAGYNTPGDSITGPVTGPYTYENGVLRYNGYDLSVLSDVDNINLTAGKIANLNYEIYDTIKNINKEYPDLVTYPTTIPSTVPYPPGYPLDPPVIDSSYADDLQNKVNAVLTQMSELDPAVHPGILDPLDPLFDPNYQVKSNTLKEELDDLYRKMSALNDKISDVNKKWEKRNELLEELVNSSVSYPTELDPPNYIIGHGEYTVTYDEDTGIVNVRIDYINFRNPPAEFSRDLVNDSLNGAQFVHDPDRINYEEFTDLLGILQKDVLTFDVGPGISMDVTFNGIDLVLYQTVADDGKFVMRNIFTLLDEVYEAASKGVPADELGSYIKELQDAQNHLLAKVAEIGGRTRRLDLLSARYEQDELNYTQMMSDAEDVDEAEVIMYMKMAEAVYQAALSAGARIIQPTLMDFLR